MQSWYSIKVRNEGDKPKADVFIYDVIGYWGISAKNFVDEFRNIPKDAEITVAINSPGGDVFDGVAIYNIIAQRRAQVETRIDGLAASMASVIALAGRRVRMAENSFMMIHNPWGVVVGESADMIAMSDMLDKLREGLVSSYRRKTNKTDAEIKSAMDAETWFTAAEAKDWGLVDQIDEPIALAASANLSEHLLRFQNAPVDRIRASFERKKMETQNEITVDSLPEAEKAGFFATLRKILNMEPKKQDATPVIAPVAAPTAAQPTLADLIQQLADFRASVDGRLNTITGELAAQKSEVAERMKSVDQMTERQANAQSRARLASLGIPAGASPAANSTAASETIVETYASLKGAARTKFWRDNKAKILAFRQ